MSVRVRPGAVTGRCSAPGSKSVTHRAVLGAVALGVPLVLSRPLESEDTEATVRLVEGLGASVRRAAAQWRVRPPGPSRAEEGPGRVHLGGSGTTLRLGLGIAARSSRRVRLDGDPSLRRRPVAELVEPLRVLGADLRTGPPSRPLPLTVRGPIRAGAVEVRAAQSSQPLSGLLLALSGLPEPSRIRRLGPVVSAPYVRQTCWVLERLGAPVRRSGGTYRVGGAARHRPPGLLRIPADGSSAAYLWAAAAVTGGDVEVRGAFTGPQPDLLILRVLRSCGVSVSVSPRGVRVAGKARRPFDVDLTPAPDLAPLLGVLAATIPATSALRGAPQLRLKESDRRSGTVRLTRSLGASVDERAGVLRVTGTDRPRRLSLRDLADHRMLMSAAVGALAAEGPSVLGPSGAVAKSYPAFFRDLASVGAELSEVPA